MFRTLLNVMLIAGLLACPVRCCSHSALTWAVGDQSAGCSCCNACDAPSTTNDQPGDSPDDGCECPNCICEGAITHNDTDAFAALDVDCDVFPLAIDIQLSGNSASSVRPNHDQRSCCRYLSGRGARLAHQSLLV